MSTEGGAEILLLPVAAAAGVGILIAQGVMWCGKKMQENYASACQSYTDQFNRALAEQRARQEDRQFILAAIIDQYTADPHLAVSSSAQPAAIDTAVSDALRRAQAALDSAEHASRLRAEHEREVERRRLQAELVASHGLLSPAIIAGAQNALGGSVEAMLAAHAQLSAARRVALQSLTDTQLLRTNQVQQARHALAGVRERLSVIRSLLLHHYGEIDQRYRDDIERLERTLQDAQTRLDNSRIFDPSRALSDAQSAQSEVESLEQRVSVNMTDEQEQRHRQALEVRARLKALGNIVREATSVRVISQAQAEALNGEIAEIGQRLKQAEAEIRGEGIKALASLLTPFSQHVLAAVSAGQQTRIVEMVASTLDGLGFKSDLRTGTPPEVETVGSHISIRARRRGNAPQGAQGRDEKLVVFYVDKEGGITYDLSGYVGDDCVREAAHIFTALRARGLAIVDSSAVQRLSKGTANDIIPHLLNDSRFAPQLDVNKRQEHIRAVLVRVLREHMGFAQIREVGSGGAVVIDAYNGSIGYHVTLAQDGEARILKNGIDVSRGTRDQLATALPPQGRNPAAASDVTAEDADLGDWRQQDEQSLSQ